MSIDRLADNELLEKYITLKMMLNKHDGEAYRLIIVHE